MDINNTKNIGFDISKEFFEELNSYLDIESEDEKYEKALKIISSIPNIGDIQEKDKLLYYGNVSLVYYDLANIKCKKYGLSDGKRYNPDSIIDDKNRKYVDEVLNDENTAFNYCKNGVDMALLYDMLNKLRKDDNKRDTDEEIAKKLLAQYESNKEIFRKITQELSIMYYLIWDEDKFMLYGKYAEEYNSLNVMNLFLRYYCNKQDYDNAYHYYELIHAFPVDFYGNIENNLALKIEGHKIYWDFLFSIGQYEEALRIGEECKEFVIRNKLHIDILLFVEEHIKNCKERIKEFENNKFPEDKLLKYFDNDVLKLMSDDNKIYVITSLNIYEYMKSNEITMDYSATLMPIMKAIENIMFDIICKKYHTFILDKKEIDKDMIEKFINKKTGNLITKMYKLELGDALYLIGKEYEKEITPNKYFLEFCEKNNVANSRDVIIKVYTELDKLRKKRNCVAHKDRINEEDVKECYGILLENIRFIKYLYVNFRFVFE